MFPFLSKQWQATRNRRLVIACILLGLLCLALPLQKFFSMGRYQHYSVGVALIGFGHILQLAVSWRSLSFWGRISYLITGIFFEVISYVFWTHPWLDPRVAAQTFEKQHFRGQLMVQYLLGSFIVLFCWLKWWSSESRNKSGASAEELGGSES